ncbi:substrate-binding domain-containing protein [Roseicella aquatilis]|uniref:ABC transporter substrate-binding protein n=1 Tax=Roseicella aquatilis TaxID=2527868 RepID=A0A4R4D5J3_9PROT|nr:substrate-binding domain-containing protein [Roseicella aquatilis]TCZ53396.1 ABC transporter substrate-binding protein [Roseicella aquatilis]
MTRRLLLLAAVMIAAADPARAAEPLRVYGPGGPLPAMREAAEAFGRARGIDVQVTAGPTPAWIERARADADMVFSGSEAMMSDFIAAMPDIDPASVVPLYLRPAAILVRPGNPGRIGGVADLLRPGHRILVVNGAGQQGLWEDVAGRLGDIASLRAFRSNIAVVAKNSAEARQAWMQDRSLDAWLIWNIWQVANPTLADTVPVEPGYRIYRDTGIALTRNGARRPEAQHFAEFLAGPEGARIFARWGWVTPASR